MKYTIEGFSQEEAIKLGLQVEHLVLLRWFVDFAHTGKMAMKTIDGYQAYWVRYSAAIEDLPLLKIGKDRIYRKFKELAEAGVLRHFSIKDETGSFSFYAFGEEYERLCFQREGGTVKTKDGLYKNNGRSVENHRTPSVENNRPKDPNTSNPNTIQTNSARARSPINAIPESSKTDLPSEKEVFDLLVEKLFPEKQAGKLAASFCEEMQARKKEKPSFKISSLQGYLASYLAGKGIQPEKEPVYKNDELEQRRRKVEEENARIEQDFGSRENWLKAQKEAIRLKKEGTKTA